MPLLLLVAGSSAATDYDRLREEAVVRARSGDLANSISTLEKYHQAAPDNLAILADLVVLLGWQGNHDRAVELFTRQNSEKYPDYCLESAILSYRSLGQSEPALPLVDLLLERNPEKISYTLRKAQLLIDVGWLKEAAVLLNQLRTGGGDLNEVQRVEGYLATAGEDWIGALAIYQDLEATYPGDTEALHGQVNALLHLGAPFRALQLMDANKELFDAAIRVAVLQSRAGLLLRWSSHASDDTAESLYYAGEGLKTLESAQSLLDNADIPDARFQRRIQYDTVVALTNLQRYGDAVGLYEELLAGGDVPPYVSLAGAGSLLSLKEPHKAKDLLESVFGTFPEEQQERLTLFYSYIESEDFSSAYQLIDGALASTPEFRRLKGSPEYFDNDEYLELAIVACQSRLYGDQLEDAWQRAKAMYTTAPANSWLSQLIGQVASARSWPRTAYTYYQQAHGLNPASHWALEGMGQSALALHEYGEAEMITTWLKERYPDEVSTARIEKDLYWAQRPDFWADLEYSYSESPEQDGFGIVASSEVISSPLTEHLHLSLQARYAKSELPEGDESFWRIGGGLEYINNAYSVLALVNYNDSSVEEVGAVLRGVATPNDQLTLELQGELFSDATPLRALYHGITEDRLAGSLIYRVDERRNFSLSGSGGWFSDDNRRLEGGLGYSHKLVDIPRFDLDGTLDFYGSVNSRDIAPYFNPESDYSITGTVKGEHLLYRFYDRSLVQQLSGSLGIYGQENYDTGAIGNVGYELRYKHYPRVEATLGAEVGQARYDGEDEWYYKLRILFHAKF